MNNMDKLKSTINNWWIYLILGVLFIVGAMYVFSVPAASYLTLSIFFAAFILIDGVGGVSLSMTNRERMEGWGWQLASGIISVFIGLALFIHPSMSMAILPIYIGFWVLMKGSLVIGTSLDLRTHKVNNWGFVFVMGLLNTVLGLAMILNPIFGVSMVLILTAIALLSLGFSMITVSLWLKRIKTKVVQLKATNSDKLEELKTSIEHYINNEPTDIKSALKHIKEKVDGALE